MFADTFVYYILAFFQLLLQLILNIRVDFASIDRIGTMKESTYYLICILASIWANGRISNMVHANVNYEPIEKSINDDIIYASTAKIVCEYFAQHTSHFHITHTNSIDVSLITSKIYCSITYTIYQVDKIDSNGTNVRFYNLLLAENYSDFG